MTDMLTDMLLWSFRRGVRFETSLALALLWLVHRSRIAESIRRRAAGVRG
jgi:hypothetical protein